MALFNLPKQFHPDFVNKKTKPIGPVEIDWLNPLTRGLKFYPTFSGNQAIDLISGEVGVNTGTITGGSTPNEGSHLAVDGSAGILFANVVHDAGVAGHTMMARYAWNGNAGDFQTILSLPNNSDIGIYAPRRSGTEEFMSQDTLDSNAISWSSATILANEFNTIAVSHDVSSTPGHAYKNGVEHTADSSVNQVYAANDTGVELFVGQGTEHARGTLIWVAVWNRELTSAEMRSMHDDPYQILKPALPLTYAQSSGVAAQNIDPVGIASAEAFGTVVLATGAVDISPIGIVSAEAFGTPVITSTIDISPTAITSEEAFGLPVITAGAVNISPVGIVSSEAFGLPSITTDAQVITPVGIASGEAFGTPTLTTGAVNIAPIGIVSEETFGTVQIAVAGEKAIKIEGQDSLVINTNLGSTTLYFNGTDYFAV